MGTIILVYGAILAAFGIAFRLAAPPKTALIITTSTIGILALLIGVAACFGEKRRRWIVITAVASTVFMVAQSVGEWTAGSESSGAIVRILTTFGAILSFSMLLYGVHGERPPEFYQEAALQPDRGSGKKQAG